MGERDDPRPEVNTAIKPKRKLVKCCLLQKVYHSPKYAVVSSKVTSDPVVQESGCPRSDLAVF